MAKLSERHNIKQKLIISDLFSYAFDGSIGFTGEELDTFFVIRVVINMSFCT